MRYYLTATIILLFLNYNAISQVNPNSRYQSGYVKKNGKYVQPHYKTQSNKTNIDNYSTKPNQNFRTGKPGKRAADYTPGALNYGKGKTINTGPKGGQYYQKFKNKKTYVPKRRQVDLIYQFK